MKKQGIVVFAFSSPNTTLCNQIIGEMASDKAKILDIPILTQEDISITGNVEFVPEIPGSPPPTLRIARKAVQWAQKNKLTILWIVCAKPHLWRCVRDMKQAIKESEVSILICIHEKINSYPMNVWFCSDSRLWHTKTKLNWFIRETILKITPFFIYKNVAK